MRSDRSIQKECGSWCAERDLLVIQGQFQASPKFATDSGLLSRLGFDPSLVLGAVTVNIDRPSSCTGMD